MRRLFFALLVLIVAVALGLWLREDGGSVAFTVAGWHVEMSLLIFGLVVILLVSLAYVVATLLSRTAALPERFRLWSGRRRQERARKALNEGLLAVAEGRYQPAERALMRHVRESETPLLNYLAAALSAQRRGARDERDRYLALAEGTGRGSRKAVRLLQAQLQVEAGQWEEAQATLNDLYEHDPAHPRVLELLLSCSEALDDWDRIAQLLPELRRRNVIRDARLAELERKAACHQLTAAARAGEVALDRTWRSVPRNLRRDAEVVDAYAQALVSQGRTGQAEALLRGRLQADWDERLLRRYSALPDGDDARRLGQIEKWLKQRPEDPALLYIAGLVALRNRMWERARHYLEAAVARAARPEGYRALGALLEYLGEDSEARSAYRRALEVADVGSRLPEFPAIEDALQPEGGSAPPREAAS